MRHRRSERGPAPTRQDPQPDGARLHRRRHQRADHRVSVRKPERSARRRIHQRVDRLAYQRVEGPRESTREQLDRRCAHRAIRLGERVSARPVRWSSAEMFGTPNVRNRASSSARVVSNGKSTRVERKTMRW